MKTSRQCAVEALGRIEKDGAWSGPALAGALDAAKLSVQDRGFATALFYGTLTRQYTIDKCIAVYSKRPISKMDRDVRNIIRTAFYQLLYMDAVPDHAAVSEGVNLTKKMKKHSASGFVNGILRSFLRDNKALPKLSFKNLSYKLAFEYSCAPELVSLWLDSYGEEKIKKLLEESLLPPPTFLRVNQNKGTPDEVMTVLENEGLSPTRDMDLEFCISVGTPGALHHSPAYKEGRFYLQDRSSQYAAEQVGASSGERILDVCAAPGGKSFVLSQQVGASGEIVSTDLYPHRIEEMRSRQQALGFSNILTQTRDMREYYPELGEFHRVLCDVPCSGYGTIRRSPEIKYQPPKDFLDLPRLQYELVVSAAKYCKIGGILVYSTCTLNPSENENVVSKFLDSHPDFLLRNTQSIGTTLPIGHLGGDGFYIAVLAHQPGKRDDLE